MVRRVYQGEWVRWTLVAHGGYLVTLPGLVRTLSGLYATLNTRAGALPRLLALQGRLDMLHSQVALRDEIRGQGEEKDEGEDEGVVYVEGETREVDSEVDSDEEPEEVGMESMMIEDASYIRSPDAGEGSEEESGSEGEFEGREDVEEGMMLGSSSEEEDAGSEDGVDYEDVDEEEVLVKGKGKRV